MIEIRRSPRPAGIETRYRDVAAYSVLVVGICALFAPAVRAYFFLDDFMWLHVGRFEMSALSGWIHAFTAPVGFGYRPLSQQVFFWLGWHLFGFRPLGYHLVSLGVLVVAALYVFRGCALLTSNRNAALVAAAVFGFSGVHFDSVAWASAFTEASATAALAISFYLFVAGQSVACAIWYVAALLCDETAAPLPLLALVAGLVVQGDSLAQCVRRSLPLWGALAGYVILRIFAVGLPLSHAGPYAMHSNFKLYASLLYSAVLQAAGIFPALANVHRAAGILNVLLVASLVCITAFWILSFVRQFQLGKGGRPLRLFLFGALWFGAASTPLLVFTANNWSIYNVGIPLIGFAFCIAAPYVEYDAIRVIRWAAFATVFFFALLGALSVYGPGGWQEVDGVMRGARAAQTLYAFLSAPGEYSTRVNVVAPPAALPVAEHVSGFDYGIQALTGNSSASILYSSKPLENAEAVFVWDDARFTLVGPSRHAAKRASEAAAPFGPPTKLYYSFVQNFEKGTLNSSNHVDTPTGKGAFLFRWPLGKRLVNALTVLPGFRYTFRLAKAVQPGQQLRFQAGRPLSPGVPVRAFVDVTVERKRHRIFEQTLEPADGTTILWRRATLPLSDYRGATISITFGADATLGNPNAAWAAFADPQITEVGSVNR